MPDLRANITFGFDNNEDRHRQMSDEYAAAEEKKTRAKQEEIQKATAPLLTQFANEFTDESLVSKAKEHRMLLIQNGHLKEELLHFRKLLLSLVYTDESHNADFILQISIVWNHILDNASAITMVELYKFMNPKRLRKLLDALDLYPQESDFSLSYYMMHFPGEQWHPFPLMEIFRKLHQEAQVNYASSKLCDWIALLDEIIPST